MLARWHSGGYAGAVTREAVLSDTPMYHQFSIGQAVLLTADISDGSTASRHYTIARLMPLEAAGYGYVIRHETTGQLRHAYESQLALLPSPAPTIATLTKEHPEQPSRGRYRSDRVHRSIKQPKRLSPSG